METPTVLLENPKTGFRIRYNAADIVANPRLADGMEIVAHQGHNVVLDERFATADDYIKPSIVVEEPLISRETAVEAFDEIPKAETTKKRGRPAKGI